MPGRRKTHFTWIYLSPHLDDAALSCGGLIWEQVQQGHSVSIWTLCAGDPPDGPLSPFASSLHERWQTGSQASGERRAEDAASCEQMGAAFRHLPLPDCIYRQAGRDYLAPASRPEAMPGQASEFLYASRDAIFGPLHPAEAPLVTQLRSWLRSEIPAGVQVVCPLAIGGHVDHRLTLAAARGLRRRLWYYADYPYIAQQPEELARLEGAGWQRETWAISTRGQAAWEAAVAAHRSQISSFWSNSAAMQAALQGYNALLGGGSLWRRPARFREYLLELDS